MADRPREFRINYGHQLAQGLVFAGLGRHPNSTYFHDSSLYKNAGLLTNMAVPATTASGWTWDNILGRWTVKFDGTNDYMVAGATTGLKGISRDGWTIACYAKWNSGTLNAVISLGDSQGAPDGTLLINRNGTIQAYQANVYRDSGVATPTTWTHLALTRESASVGTLYVNGVAYSANPNYTTGDVMALYLGKFSEIGYCSNSWVTDGLAYNRVLSASEITTLANLSDAMLSGLLLPPRRVLFAATAAAATGWKPYFARRQSRVIGGGVS